MNVKGIAYKTEWIEFPDIEPLYKKHGIATTATKADGTPLYSVPLIYDPSTKMFISDSFAIAEYLDRTYPGPKLFPYETLAIQSLVGSAYARHIWPVLPLAMITATLKLHPVSEVFYREKITRPFVSGVSEDETSKNVRWDQFREGLGEVDTWYSKTAGSFLMGDTVSWGDIVVASSLIWIRILWGEESKEWKMITSWHGGRWAGLLNAVSKYETIS